MKKVVLSLALVAMMFVSCKDASENVEETAVAAEEVTTEALVEEVAIDTTVVTEVPAAEVPAAE